MIRTAAPKLRMLAGPNGSGKSTLFRYLRDHFNFPFGFCLNPDDIDRELARSRRVYVGGWGMQLDRAALVKFVQKHELASRLSGPQPTVDQYGCLIAPKGYRRGYFTSIFCDFLRLEWMAKEESFTFETVMSHPGKVQLLEDARETGYRTYLYYVCTSDPRINTDRIANRVKRGGHAVAADAVMNRYARSLELLPRAIRASTRAYVFDNSEKRQRLIAEFEDGSLVRAETELPSWFVGAVPLAR